MSPICNQCDEQYESNGDCSGICESCRDIIAARPVESCTLAELAAYNEKVRARNERRRAEALRETRWHRTTANDNRRAPEQTGRDAANIFKGFL